MPYAGKSRIFGAPQFGVKLKGITKKQKGFIKWKTKLKTVGRQETLLITIAMIQKQIRWMPNCKASRPDSVQGYWSEPIWTIRPTLVTQLYEAPEISNVLKRLTTGTDKEWLTVPLVKDRENGVEVTKFCPITYLPIMWKLDLHQILRWNGM